MQLQMLIEVCGLQKFLITLCAFEWESQAMGFHMLLQLMLLLERFVRTLWTCPKRRKKNKSLSILDMNLVSFVWKTGHFRYTYKLNH